MMDGPLDILKMMTAIQIGLVYNYLPLSGSALRHARADGLEARRRGDRPRREPVGGLPPDHVRLTAPGLLTGTLLVFIPMMGEYVIPLVLGGGRVDLIGNVIQRSFLEAQDYALGSALAMLVMGGFVLRRALPVPVDPHGAGIRWLSSRASRRLPRRPAFVIGVIAVVAFLIKLAGGDVSARGAIGLVLGVAAVVLDPPLPAGLAAARRLQRDRLRVPVRADLVVIIYAFNSGNNVASFESISTVHFKRALDDDSITSSIERSFQFAIASSLIATVFGTAAALALARTSRRVRTPFDILVFLTLVVPELVIAVSSLIFFVNVGYELARDDVPRPHDVQRLARAADRAGAVRVHGLVARGGEPRPRRRTRSGRSGR